MRLEIIDVREVFIALFHVCNLQVVGEHSRPLVGQVISISEPQGIATVHFDIPAGNGIPRTNDTLEVPLSRLQPPSNEVSLYGNKVGPKNFVRKCIPSVVPSEKL